MDSKEKNLLENSILNRFLRYVQIDTQSNHHNSEKPTTPGQWDLLRLLEKELSDAGIMDIELDQYGYLIARIPSTLPEGRAAPVIGFMAHVDTAGDMSGKNVKSKVIEQYDGKEIQLSGEWVLSPDTNPELLKYTHQTLITTDGTTLLGADDKAGAAEIMAAVEYLMNHPEIEHGEVELIFTPDEETGTGMDLFPVSKLNSRCCYTMDGGERGTVDAECFNAAKVEISFTGVMYHLGSARGRMVNAVTMAASFITMLPQAESPEATDSRYGYYCPLEIEGTAESSKLTLYLRDFEIEEIERRRKVLDSIAGTLEDIYPGGKVAVDFNMQYLNMREYISKDPLVMEKLEKAAANIGIAVSREIIRGGTDGARLCAMGIPTPNIFTGGHNYHSRYEWAALSVMTEAAQLIQELIILWGEEHE
ncbi:MAG: peptidase T [Spirochaetales bacterium]|nr:peptidase T [Spirochaetales bacterium]